MTDDDAIPPKPTRRPFPIQSLCILVYIALLPLAAAITLFTSHARLKSQSWLIDMRTADVFLGGAIGFFSLSIMLIVCGTRRPVRPSSPFAKRWAWFGIAMMFWAMTFVGFWGLAHGVQFIP